MGADSLLSTTQIGGVIAWPIRLLQHVQVMHVTWWRVLVWDNAELDALSSIIYSCFHTLTFFTSHTPRSTSLLVLVTQIDTTKISEGEASMINENRKELGRKNLISLREI